MYGKTNLISWQMGSKTLSIHFIPPIILVPILLLIASISLWWTILCFGIAFITLFLFTIFVKRVPKSKFFVILSISTAVVLYIIFEFIVIPFLQILVEENIALSLLILGFGVCFYCMKSRTNRLKEVQGIADYKVWESEDARAQNYCQICQVNILNRDHHSVWFDCCIGQHNQCLYLSAITFAILALMYSANLTLTSVCHPYIFYKTILLPDDCSEVYQQFELSLSFVAALWSLGISLILIFVLLKQIVLVSMGLSTNEWNKLPVFRKFLCGYLCNRQNNKGIWKNWARIICDNRNNY